jgi:hypothetical protein
MIASVLTLYYCLLFIIELYVDSPEDMTEEDLIEEANSLTRPIKYIAIVNTINIIYQILVSLGVL